MSICILHKKPMIICVSKVAARFQIRQFFSWRTRVTEKGEENGSIFLGFLFLYFIHISYSFILFLSDVAGENDTCCGSTDFKPQFIYSNVTEEFLKFL